MLLVLFCNSATNKTNRKSKKNFRIEKLECWFQKKKPETKKNKNQEKERKKTFGFKNIINKMVSRGDYKDCMPFNLLPLLWVDSPIQILIHAIHTHLVNFVDHSIWHLLVFIVFDFGAKILARLPHLFVPQLYCIIFHSAVPFPSWAQETRPFAFDYKFRGRSMKKVRAKSNIR